VFLFLFAGVISIPTFSAGGFSYELEGVAAGDGQCEVCVDYYKTLDSTTYGYWRSAYDWVMELNATRGECCYGGGASCPPGGCNQHVIQDFATVFNFNSTNTTGYYIGNITGGGDQTATCTPPGSSALICSNFVFTYQSITTVQNYPVGNQTFTLNENSLLETITMNQWPFDSASWGIRLKLLVQDRYATVSTFVLQPGDSSPSTVQFNNFNAAEMTPTNSEQGQGGVKLSAYALVDGVAIAANISGFWAHPYDINARYIYIDIPKFSSSMSYSTNLYFAGGSSTTSDALFSNEPVWLQSYFPYIIAVAAVFGLCAIFGCFSLIYCKCCRKGRRD